MNKLCRPVGGVTVTVDELPVLDIPLVTLPLLYEVLNGPIPVKLMVMLPLCPAHRLGVVVEITAVGKGNTVTFTV